MVEHSDFIIKVRNDTTGAKMEAWRTNRIKILHQSLPIINDLRNTSQTTEDFERYTRNYNNIVSELLRLTSRP